jgi:hypothetical protein
LKQFLMSTFSLTWWHMPAILALSRLRQENYEFKASLSYIARPCLNNKQTKVNV